jgi:hypothetical protein
MYIQQMAIEFDTEADRLRWRVATEHDEGILLFTRRCVKIFWPILCQGLLADPKIAIHADAETRNALVSLEHDRIIRECDFSTPYRKPEPAQETGATAEGQEAAPAQAPNIQMLVTRIEMRDKGGGQIEFGFFQGTDGVHINATPHMLHIIAHLMKNVALAAEWALDLALPGLATGMHNQENVEQFELVQ